ncbi:hypothetical protein CYMTET_14504 [Cymbomonas tetramitiformis]|uniref:Uncharacterized protein n=1 Tax=Cymbomonas tetramitiformis TaxID=36881 RepID=A0AAE0GHE1_9CHLO|nr:hypothetical protein CYMTET_14504 [Cymbomonas tetramitiformis]
MLSLTGNRTQATPTRTYIIKLLFSLSAELFGTLFDINLGTDVFFTRCEENAIFGATVDAYYSIPWHLLALGNPIYIVERIEQTTSHAVLSVATSTEPLAAHKFKFLAPRSALGFTDRSTGACFNVDVLIVQNALAAQKFPVPPFALNKLARHFKGRISLLPPEYESTWTVPPSQAPPGGPTPFPRRLRNFASQLKGNAALRLEHRRLVSRWCEREGVSNRPCRHGGDAVNAQQYAKLLDKECTGTARIDLDRNAGVGGIVCQQRYFEMLVKERETSAAHFSNVEESPEAMVTQLAAQYRHLGLQTVVKLDTAGTYGNLYALLKDT